ncbi:MAG: hypothetical protein A2144_12885 [Chloroflexi bacterium RBG_16_50_9]|nr:MAG: hypothetical protein A2144_12885 [Chloroflexi bacterium RBG_16_50_9]
MSAWFYHYRSKSDNDDVLRQPGQPIENVFAESFIGRFRNECLNESWFMNLKHARDIIEDWRRDYNELRPQSSLKGSTPKEYAEAATGLKSLVLLIQG